MNYKGNQLIKGEDAVSTLNFSNQGDFRNEVSKTIEYEYDNNGNMTIDLNQGISNISYNSLNLPISLVIANSLGSATNNYTDSANGKKLKVEMKFGNQTRTTDYVGNMIYENGALKYILVDGSYVENGQYHFYIQDHLGNNRVVAKADGTVIQTNHYYPFGMTFMEDGTHDTKAQPYKYNGKEFDGERGLNLYDFLARSMDPAEGRFTSIDRLAEKYYSVSPYAYCGNNPVKYIEPDGRMIILPKGTSTKNIYLVLANFQKLTNDRLVYSTQKDGTIRIKVASLGEGNKTAGSNLIRRLNSSDKTLTTDVQNSQGNFTNGAGNKAKATNYTNAANDKGSAVIVSFDPISNLSIMTKDPKTGNFSGENRPNQIGLGRELIHAEHYMDGDFSPESSTSTHSYKDALGNTITQTYKTEELRTFGVAGTKKNDITENQLKKEQKLNPRGAY